MGYTFERYGDLQEQLENKTIKNIGYDYGEGKIIINFYDDSFVEIRANKNKLLIEIVDISIIESKEIKHFHQI